MKKIVILLALVIQGLFTNVNATVITARMSEIQPVHDKPVIAGAFIPLLNIDLKGSDRKFIPSVYLVVRTTGVSYWDQQVFTEVFVGSPEKLISNSEPIENGKMVLVGPVHLAADEWRTVTLSARVSPDLSKLAGRNAGLEVSAVAADGYLVELSDQVAYDGTFPIRGALHSIDHIAQAEQLAFKNVSEGLVIPAGRDAVLAKFEVTAQGGDVRVSSLPLSFLFAEDVDAKTILNNVKVVGENGVIIAEQGSAFFFETKRGFHLTFRDSIITVPQGTNAWFVTGTVSTNGLPESSTLRVGVEYFGEAFGVTTANWMIPTGDQEGDAVQILNITEPFSGVFQNYLTVGSVGGDVKALQEYLAANGFVTDTTGYFDEGTKKAVALFQEANGIPGTGFVGPLTVALLNRKPTMVVVAAKIAHVSFLDRADGRKDIFVVGSVRPNISYLVEVSDDLKTWKVVGQTSPEPTGMLKQHVGAAELGQMAFFRLVEKP